MKAPAFWGQHGQKGGMSSLLWPLSCLYSLAGQIRHKIAKPYDPGIPVICIGNLVAGGTGKTPVALSLGIFLKAQGKNIHYLSRGYGGSLNGPVEVNLQIHTAAQVGDEPLLLANIAPTWISKDRVAGAKAALKAGADIIVMDDGFQNPYLVKTLSFVVVDAAVGFGNEAVIPAGPLRESIRQGLSRADAAILIGKGDIPKVLTDFALHRAQLIPADCEKFKDKKYIAFAGIGRPQKFFDTMSDAGLQLLATHSFADHHKYTNAEISHLKLEAQSNNAKLITTEKDMIRMPTEMRKDIEAFPVVLYWEDDKTPSKLLWKVLSDG